MDFFTPWKPNLPLFLPLKKSLIYTFSLFPMEINSLWKIQALTIKVIITQHTVLTKHCSTIHATAGCQNRQACQTSKAKVT
uniref:Uncharacterized protein n=1 Tax=Triticum urartu TaxID=4572 RepID=A0A8R7QSC8_TRIUA